jgi:ssDNA-binding Zn-finger/Zn-ribbon topoisomerase 1
MSVLAIVEHCPDCNSPLKVRHRKRDRKRFIGCDAWPRCNFVSYYSSREQRMAKRILQLECALDVRRDERQHAVIDVERELRSLIAATHPDRWPNAPDIAHEFCARLTDLRRRVQA